MSRVRQILSYLIALWRPSLRLERSPERWLMPLIIATLSVLAIFAGLLPLKIAAGGAYDARGVEGHLAVHVAQGDLPLNEFEDQVAALVSRLQENENIAQVRIATGPELALSLEALFGDVAREDLLYGGIVRLDLVEKAGQDANIENLQFAVSGFQSANVDDFRVWKEASRERTRQALVAGLFVLILVAALIATTLNLTIRLALRMHEPTLKVLHHLGATDGFGGLLFQATTFRRALIGAVVGALLSAGLLWLLSLFLNAQGYVGAAQIGPWQIAMLVLLPLGLVALSVMVARLTSLTALKKTY